MTDAEYMRCQTELLDLARRLARLKLVAFLARIEECEAVAPLVQPSAYQRGYAALGRIKRLARAAAEVQNRYEALEIPPTPDDGESDGETSEE